jgi:hypothetical protein
LDDMEAGVSIKQGTSDNFFSCFDPPRSDELDT